MKISFLLTGEGTSDLMLQSHIETILVDAGFTEVHGEAPDIGLICPNAGRSVRDKLGVLKKYYPDVDVIFFHRDADGVGVEARIGEIADGCAAVEHPATTIPVIPVRELETWLLADQSAINVTAGNTNLQFQITCIPGIRRLESVADPKRLLLDALCEASQAQGGKLAKFKKRFNDMRRRLAEGLDPLGPVRELPSYQEFRRNLAGYVASRLEQ